MKLTHCNLSPLEFSPTQDPAGGWLIVLWSMNGQSLWSQLTHSSLVHETVYHLCENYMKKKQAYIYATWNWAFNNLLWQNRETDLIYFLTHWGLDKVADIFQTIFSSAFSLIKMYFVTIKFSLILVASGPINNTSALVKIMAWRRPCDSRYLNQWWLIYRRIYVSFGPNELMPMFVIVATGINIFGVVVFYKW